MSSKLKDARWQLASEMAGDDGMDFYAMDYTLKDSWLHLAQKRLDGEPQEFIDRLAARFNEEG